MKSLTGIALVAFFLSGGGAQAEKTLELRHKTYRDWKIVLPQETFERVSGDFYFPGSSSTKFRTELDGIALRVDRDGDGELESKVEGDEGVVTLRGERKDGGKFLYAVRLRRTNAGWHYTTAGAMLGIVEGQKVRIIDQNNNGRYDEYGRDAMVIGEGSYASFLSQVIDIRGKLYAIDVAEDGSQLRYKPYEGDRGVLDLATKFATKGKLLSAIVRSADGMISFNMTGRPMMVPAGEYQFYQGQIGLGRNIVQVSRGKVPTLTVANGETRSVAFGEPVEIDFEYVRQPGRVIMAPQLVRYVGRAGEVYNNWTPFGGSPQFEVKDMATGAQIALAIFGGT